MMPKLILKRPYLKGKAAPTKRSGYLKYIATRDGVERIPSEKQQLSVTQKQKQLIQKLLQEFPDARELFEYQDYRNNPTVQNASEFIEMAIETHYEATSASKIYAKYIATRPGVELQGSHGLFSSQPIESLAAAMREIDDHEGGVWTHIVSLKREDAQRPGSRQHAAGNTPLMCHPRKISSACNNL